MSDPHEDYHYQITITPLKSGPVQKLNVAHPARACRRTSPSPFKGERVSTEIPGLLILGKMLFWRNIHFTAVMA